MMAARCGGRGGAAVVRLLIARCRGDVFTLAALVNARATGAERGSAALHLACERGHVEVVDALLAGGANVDAETGMGATPMMVAVAGGHEGCVALLLEAGAQVNSPSTWLDGRSARILAEERARAEAQEMRTGAGTEIRREGVHGRILVLLEGAGKPCTVRGAIMGARKPPCHQPDFPVGRATPGARAADASMPPPAPPWSATVAAFSARDSRGVRFT
jgi:hypothetical protein